MTKTITLDPITRVEGHISVTVERNDTNGTVDSANSSGTLFRGFEILLQGKDPRDAIHITQRVCGVCPTSHAMAAALAIEKAAGVTVPDNARLIRNLILGADFLHSHILHFYQLALSSYIKGPAMPPWTPGYEVDLRFGATDNQRLVEHYVQALSIRRQAHEMGAIFGGRLPHIVSYVYGGVSSAPGSNLVSRFRNHLNEIIAFVDSVYQADVELLTRVYSDYFSIGRGYANLLTFGVFDLNRDGSNKLLPRGLVNNGKGPIRNVDLTAIVEHTQHSWYNNSTSGLNPAEGETAPNPGKPDAYSWLKAPRYQNSPCEAGPLARMWMSGDYQSGISVMDRHVARMMETRKIAHAMRTWLDQLDPTAPTFQSYPVPDNASGVGLSEAPRGALGHWLQISQGAIASYQILTPTCWNSSPRDDAGIPGPLEEALRGTPLSDPAQPVEVLRVVQSFDPCLACAVH